MMSETVEILFNITIAIGLISISILMIMATVAGIIVVIDELI